MTEKILPGGTASVADHCPHCGTSFSMEVRFKPGEDYAREHCPECDKGIWFKFEGIDDQGTATIRIGTPVGIDLFTPGMKGFNTIEVADRIEESLQNSLLAGQLSPEVAGGINALDGLDQLVDENSHFHKLVLSIVASVWIELKEMKPSMKPPVPQQNENGIRKYRLTNELGLKRQGVSLSAGAAATWLSQLARNSDSCGFTILERQDDPADKSVLLTIQWNGGEVKKLDIGGVPVQPEEVDDAKE